MKIWLKRYRGCLLAGIAMVLLALSFGLGWRTGQYATDRQAYAALWEAIVSLPDSEQCALCGEATRYHAPCLIDLSTGQMGELTV